MKKILTAAIVLFGIVAFSMPANALFIIDSNPGGVKLYIDVANKNVSDFTGNVGSQSSGPLVDIHTTGNVDTGSGYANISPVKDAVLKNLIFTPADGTLFGDFSFQGQLDTAGFVTVKVWDSSTSTPEIFDFYIDKANAVFDRIGIVSTDKTIYKVEISNDSFKEVKQIDFSYTLVPEPVTMILLGLGLLGVGIAVRKRS
jgi:hypothetical protein